MKSLSTFITESISDQSELDQLRQQYPNFTFNLVKSDKFDNAYLASIYKVDKYVAGLRGPISYESAILFFKNTVKHLL
jgi:hypothetical protein